MYVRLLHIYYRRKLVTENVTSLPDPQKREDK
jgi:hypothetical protein